MECSFFWRKKLSLLAFCFDWQTILMSFSCNLRVEVKDHTEGCKSEEQPRHQIIAVTRIFALISKNSTFAICTVVFGFKIADIKVFHVLVGFGGVTNILKLSRGVLARILKQNLLATWVLKVGHIVNFVID